ncbi:MAG: ABC transporter substrate-binding protein [Chloroflexi bacterium]|nr:ABC transporter substrate-binding protein [Chloroflexota bacterium]
MTTRSRQPRRPIAGALAVGALALAVASPAAVMAQDASPAPATTTELRPLTVGLGYIPSVQFAPFYLAKVSGAYEAAGLDVTLQNQIDPELITLIAQGAVDIGMGDGTSVITARSQGIPITAVASIYARFPSVVVARADSGIATPADLAGASLGTPGRYGSGWIMLQALLSSADLTPDDLSITLYPDFGQATALGADQVQAATGFLNNEPIQLARQGIEVNVLTVDDIVPLPGPGLVTGTGTLAARHDDLAAFVAVTLDAMARITADPQLGLDATFQVVPDLAADADLQRAVLDATIAAWHSPLTEAQGLGAMDPDAWTRSIEFMTAMPESPVGGPVVAADIVSTELLPVR